MELKRIKRVEAFDFDDTLAKTRSKIGVKLENDSTNFADFLEGNGLEVLDENRNGVIEWDEFLKWWSGR